jgi:hexosaminidase
MLLLRDTLSTAGITDAHGPIAGSESFELLLLRNQTLQVLASDRAGLFYGTRTALQLIQGANHMPLPLLRIIDAPISSYRGVMIDIARQPHSFDFHMAMLDKLAAAKLNVYQLHSSDDSGYTMPSAAFPTLPDQTKALTSDQAKKLQAKAAALAIEIVAEIDMPGHSGALLKHIPSLAAVNVRTGQPCQQINISSPTALATLQTLIKETSSLFPGKWHHLGADEVRFDYTSYSLYIIHYTHYTLLGALRHTQHTMLIHTLY